VRYAEIVTELAPEAAGLGFANVRDFGAVGNGVTDDTPAVQKALAAVMPRGGIVFFPVGVYRLTDSLTIAQANSITLLGEGVGPREPRTTGLHTTGTALLFEPTVVNGVVVLTGSFCGIQNLEIQFDGAPKEGYAVVIGQAAEANVGSFLCFIRNCRIDNCWNGVLIKTATETRISDLLIWEPLGTVGIQYQGANDESHASYRCVIERFNGSSDSSRADSNKRITWILMDSWAYSLVLDEVVCIGGGIGFEMMDSASTGSSYPMWAFCFDLECDHNQQAAVVLTAGQGFYGTSLWLGSCIAGNGLTIAASHLGEVAIGESRIMGNAQHGMLIQNGPVDVQVSNCVIVNNSAPNQPGTYNGVTVAAGASNFSVTNCRIGTLPPFSPSQGWGVLVSSGTSDNYVIANNNLTRNIEGGLSDGGTGANKIVTPNLA
jgi:hypothetical protein